MQEVAGERGGYLHGRGALDSDDLLYLKEQMEAEEDAERLLRRTEKRAFAAFKKAASLADSSPATVPLPLRVEPKPKSGIRFITTPFSFTPTTPFFKCLLCSNLSDYLNCRQQDLLKKVVEVKPKRHRVSSPSNGNQTAPNSSDSALKNHKSEVDQLKAGESPLSRSKKAEDATKAENPVKSLLGLAYESSDDEDD
eukprot:XP_010662031.1 PREDICTED: uncharacterized protein LOC100242649 isoform X2 [Vitis vinifera]